MARRSRHGFTLIELLIVIGIILILMTIGVIGFIHIDKVGSEKSTATRLALCQSLQAEYEQSASLTAVEGPSPAIYQTGASYNNPTDVGPLAASRTSQTSFDMVYNTGRIVSLFAQMPKVKSDLAQLGTSALMLGSSGAYVDVNNSNLPLYVVLDAWKNPIIYVPSTGLPNVSFGSGANKVPKTIVSIDNRPFWASAGQDGDFSTGDDNLYSVPVKAVP